MTEVQFWKKLRGLKNVKWTEDRYGMIRCERGDCPIIAVARSEGYVRLDNQDAEPTAILDLGMNPRIVRDIIAAADIPLTDGGFAKLEGREVRYRKRLEALVKESK